MQRSRKTYFVWSRMLSRCNNPKDNRFKHYGGRGIKVCRRWLKFENFLADMGERPQGLTIDRRHNNRGYYKSNCRWVTRRENTLNSRHVRWITFQGTRLPLTQWAKRAGISYVTLSLRMDLLGWSVRKALTTPLFGSYKGKPTARTRAAR